MFEIVFKDENKYTGEYGPVVFVEGKATTNNSWVASWFEGKGEFKVTQISKEQQSSTDDQTQNDTENENPNDLSKLTLEKLKALAEERGIEVPSKIKKDDLVEMLEEVE